jgi:L-rhamnose mutarotase
MESTPTRRAFLLRLKEGALPDYIRWHDEIWPELLAEIKASGIASVTLFEADPVVVLYSEVYDREAWDRLWHSEIHARWADEVMKPLMDYTDEGVVDARDLKEIWHLDT